MASKVSISSIQDALTAIIARITLDVGWEALNGLNDLHSEVLDQLERVQWGGVKGDEDVTDTVYNHLMDLDMLMSATIRDLEDSGYLDDDDPEATMEYMEASLDDIEGDIARIGQ